MKKRRANERGSKGKTVESPFEMIDWEVLARFLGPKKHEDANYVVRDKCVVKEICRGTVL